MGLHFIRLKIIISRVCRRLAHRFLEYRSPSPNILNFLFIFLVCKLTWKYDAQAGDAQSAENPGLLGELNDRILKAEKLQVNINKALRGEFSLEEAKDMLADMEVCFKHVVPHKYQIKSQLLMLEYPYDMHGCN
jgi:hypothetical protein